MVWVAPMQDPSGFFMGSLAVAGKGSGSNLGLSIRGKGMKGESWNVLNVPKSGPSLPLVECQDYGKVIDKARRRLQGKMVSQVDFLFKKILKVGLYANKSEIG